MAVDRFGLPLDDEEMAQQMTNVFTIPATFEKCMTIEEQLLFLELTKQDRLVAGDNITLTRNDDHTVTISSTGGGSTYRIAQITPDEGYIAAYALVNVNTGAISGSKIQIPEPGSGVTPVITATATVDNHTGIPSVQVVKTGTDEAPSFAFNFCNLKGDTGATGAPGQDGAPGQPGQDGTNGTDGVSPEVSIASITGGHSVTITDADHPSGQSFNVMDGVNGTNGTNGQDGAAATIQVGTVTTGQPGSNASVTNSGTQNAAVFDFSIPQGAQGVQGPAGPGVPSGGTDGQVLTKDGSTPYATKWATPQSGGGISMSKKKGRIKYNGTNMISNLTSVSGRTCSIIDFDASFLEFVITCLTYNNVDYVINAEFVKKWSENSAGDPIPFTILQSGVSSYSYPSLSDVITMTLTDTSWDNVLIDSNIDTIVLKSGCCGVGLYGFYPGLGDIMQNYYGMGFYEMTYTQSTKQLKIVYNVACEVVGQSNTPSTIAITLF